MNTRRTLFLITIATMAGPVGISAQDTGPARQGHVVQAPGPQYDASGLSRFFLGSEYRSLWTTPISVPVLNLGTYAGGLRPVSKGGGKQTKSLLLEAPDGRQFFFRAVDKDASVILPDELKNTVAGSIVRDQTSSALPTAPPMVARLLAAAGIPHPDEELFVLPRDPQLGEFQAEFGGLMGFLQERVGGADGPPGHWNGATEIIGSDTLLARTARSPDDRVDARAFATTRLFDVLIGDWDRHRDQWVWVRYGDGLPRRWLPVPRDRDQAFAKYDGLMFHFARQRAPQLINFKPSYGYMPGATWNGRDLDRRFLVELERPVWDSLARDLQAKLTDSAIDDAVRALPPEHYKLQGERLTQWLRERRDRLPEAAASYYEVLAGQVDVLATDLADRASVTRLPKGALELTLSSAGTGTPYYSRIFEPNATSEVRLFLAGGDDTAVVRGNGGGVKLRLLGGSGQDRLVDSSRAGSEKFYDDPDGTERTEGFANDVNRKPYVLPPPRNPEQLPPRDWGHRWGWNGWGGYGPDAGVFIGGTATLTTYGFRKLPFANQHRFRLGFATGPGTFRADYHGEFRRENSNSYFDMLLRGSGVDVLNFHGFGNEIAAPEDNEFYRVTQRAYTVFPRYAFGLGKQATLLVGPMLKYVTTDERPDRFLATQGDLYGTGDFGEVAAAADLVFDSRDRATAATRGVLLELGGKVYPGMWDVDSTYGEVHGVASTYLSMRAPLDPTLALRVGGKKLWGAFPYFEAAFVGDPSTVRLGRANRYAGDGSAYGSAELRLALARILLVLPADLGVFGLADAGRVFLEGESSDTWHTAFGGGIWLAFLDRASTMSVSAAASDEETGIYVQAGFAF
jgi:hypothetical protein